LDVAIASSAGCREGSLDRKDDHSTGVVGILSDSTGIWRVGSVLPEQHDGRPMTVAISDTAAAEVTDPHSGPDSRVKWATTPGVPMRITAKDCAAAGIFPRA
jgi:hypothetical protein